jgi:2,4-dichlorophenol 6-monooxygenase
MEIFRQHGISDAIYAEGSPARNMSQVVWQTSLGGDGKHDRKIIGSIPSYGGYEGTAQHDTYKLGDLSVTGDVTHHFQTRFADSVV